MEFKVVNNQVFFRDFDLSEYMTIKEVNIGEDGAFITAEFKASYSNNKLESFLACMVESMDKGNLIDLKEHLDAEIERREV